MICRPYLRYGRVLAKLEIAGSAPVRRYELHPGRIDDYDGRTRGGCASNQGAVVTPGIPALAT